MSAFLICDVEVKNREKLQEYLKLSGHTLVGCPECSKTSFHSHSRQGKAKKRRHSRAYVEFF